MGKLKSPTVPRKASRGMGASHRRHGTGGGMRSKVGVLWRPPGGAKRRWGALAELGQRPKGCECDGVGTRRVETPRGKRVERAATHRVNIASHGSKGSFILNDGRRSYGWLDSLLDKIPARITVVIDACYSGSAIPHLGQAGREVYVACEADELSTGEYDRQFAEALGGVEADVDRDGVVEMWEADRWGKIRIISLSNLIIPVKRYFNPEGDDDYDGLNNAFENDVKIGDYKHWMDVGIPKSEAPDPDVRDIYIEVDWMEGCLPYNLGYYSCLTTPDSYQIMGIISWVALFAFAGCLALIVAGLISGGISAAIGICLLIILAIIYIILTEIIWWDAGDSGTFQELFEEHNINLHIDDGTGSWKGIGGGTKVKESKELLASRGNRKDGKYNDIYDYLEDEFAENRRGEFHYALCSKKIDPEEKKWIGGKAQCHPYEGEGETEGEGWFVIDLDGPNNERFTQSELTRNFFHEMGHAIGALHDKYLPYDYISSMNDITWYEGKNGLKYEFLKQYIGYNDYNYPEYNDPSNPCKNAENEWIILYHQCKNTLQPWW